MPINKQEELEENLSDLIIYPAKDDSGNYRLGVLDIKKILKSILEAKQSGIEEERSKNNMAVLGVITSLGYEGALTSDQIIELNTRLSEALKE